MLSRASTALPRSTFYTGPISESLSRCFWQPTRNGKSLLTYVSSEKLCLVDGKVAFMGGLDMCMSSWCPADSLRTDSHRLWKI